MTEDLKATVLIADDHPPTRAGVRLALEEANFEVACEVGSGDEAVTTALECKPDIALLDVHMPGGGIEAARQITAHLPNTAVVMLTVSRNDQDLFDSLRAGAAGYLLKDTDPDRLGNALRGVLAGEAALPRTLVARLVEEFRSHVGHKRVKLPGRKGVELTSREWEVLDLLKVGATTKDMADRLFLSQATIRSHVATLLKKLEVDDRQAAVDLMERS